MGVRQAILPTARNASAGCSIFPAGRAVPDHGHRGMELTLVLQGAFRRQRGPLRPGDVEIATEDLEHPPVAEAGADCICLAATDAPLRFNGLIPRFRSRSSGSDGSSGAQTLWQSLADRTRCGEDLESNNCRVDRVLLRF